MTVPELFLAHTPVMLAEVLQYLAPQKGEIFLDGTFGAGGMSQAILNSCECSVVAVDKDPNVKIYADKMIIEHKNKFSFIASNFSDVAAKTEGTKFDGIILDLGVSSMQIDDASRGFSFTHDGPLDMRMSKEGINAADFINNASEEEIADVIYRYGEENLSRKIAKRIVKEREMEAILSTARLANIVRSSVVRRGKIDQATKTFQAIRIYINDELKQLEEFLQSVRKLLKIEGRVVIISFHSLEDRIVKSFFKLNAVKTVARSKYAVMEDRNDPENWLKILTKKPLSSSVEEIKSNPRCRSARLRAAKKIGN